MEILSLTNDSKYNKIIEYYETNKDKPFDEWLTFDKLLTRGKQGIAGILKTANNDKIVFKISQYINHLVQQELTVMFGLKQISEFCPHFCKGIGLIDCKVDAKYKKGCDNPFVIENKYPIMKEVLLCEYIENSYKFYNYIRTNEISEDILYSCVKQVLLGLSFAQKVKFTHYDLHSWNIMIKKCNKDIVFLYKIDEENQFCVPTMGYYPVIIDYGFSYIQDFEDGPLFPSMSHTDVGFTSSQFDAFADPKLFLVTVSEEIRDKRETPKSKTLRRIVKNMFGPLNICWSSGWDKDDEKGVSDYIIQRLDKYNTKSELFKSYDHYCIDLLQTLIILPLQKQDYSNIDNVYKIFLKEWIKIENEISNPFYNLYILKNIVDNARKLRADYMDKLTRQYAITEFGRSIFDILNTITKFCRPKDLHFEKLLCSLLILAKNIEGMLFELMEGKNMKKKNDYSQLPLQTIEEMYAAITVNIPDNYVYNKNTQVLLMDSVNQSCQLFKIPPEEINNVNDLQDLTRGTYLYDIYKQNCE